MYGLRSDMTYYLKESLSVSIGCYGPTLMHPKVGCCLECGLRALLNQMSEEEQKKFEKVHREEIADVLGSDGVWFNTEVLIAVGEK